MKLKTIEVEGKTYAEMQDGKPLYIEDDGSEVAFDAPGTKDTIRRLNGEAKGHREAKEAAETALKEYEGIDPEKARESMDKLSKMDAKKLVDAGDIPAAIETALAPVREELAAAIADKERLGADLNKQIVGNAFAQSKFAAEKLTPAGVDLVRGMYADRLKIEDNNLVPYDKNGQKVYSKARPGEVATFDEALEAYVSEYPHHEHILKGRQLYGSGAPGGAALGGKSISRADFEAKQKSSPAEAAKMISDGVQITD